MCGICGFVGDDRPELIARMSAAMPHRGPDDAGEWHDPAAQAGLGHQRLSILDLSPLGRQPMANEDGSVLVTFNGEIYNFAELRQALVSKGHVFRSETDTEILVHLYEEYGEEMLDELNGMFALGIWDTKRRRLLLARDHAGIKPLYYRLDRGRIYFASEIKALLRIPDMPRKLNQQRVREYLTLLWVPGAETMLEGINKLEPGHLLIHEAGSARIRKWFNLSYEPDEALSEAQWVEQVRETFIRVTRRQMVSDVPLGAFLSGGVDSSSIVACMRNAYPERDIDCYTIRFEQGDGERDQFVDDYPYAKLVADHLRVRLHEFTLNPEITSLLPKMIWHMDEPDADPAVFPSYLIAQAARSNGTTVLLSGTGGDEVFFGYRSHLAYRHYERIPALMRPFARMACAALGAAGSMLGAQHPLVRRAEKFRRGMGQTGVNRHMALVDWSSPPIRAALFDDGGGEVVPESIRRYFESFQGTGELNRHSHVLIQSFLASHNLLYTDKSSMAASVEVRVPFLDVELMRLCARIPERFQLRHGVTKNILKQAMSNYLPQNVLHRSKTGFMAPLRKWIAQDLDEMIAEGLSERCVKARGLFNPHAVERIVLENQANQADHAYLIYALLTLEHWTRTFIDAPMN